MDNALEIHAYYSKLFEAFAVLPLADIERELRIESFKHSQSGEYRDWSQMLQRMRSYLEKSNLDGQRRESIKLFIDIEEIINNIDLSYPECRILLRESDRTELRVRFMDLIGGQNMSLALSWVTGSDKRTPDDIEALRPPVLHEDTKNRTEAIKQRLAELDKRKARPVHAVLAKTKGGDFTVFAPCPAPVAKQAPTITAPVSGSSFALLLLNYTLTELTALLTELCLLDAKTGRQAPPATPGAWAGVIHALLDENKPRLRGGSNRAIQRAFTETFGAKVSERTVQGDLGKRGSVAEQFRDRALSILNR